MIFRENKLLSIGKTQKNLLRMFIFVIILYLYTNQKPHIQLDTYVYAPFCFRYTWKRMESRRWIFLWPQKICNRSLHTIAVIICSLDTPLVPDGEDLQKKMDDSAFAPAPSMVPVPHLKAPHFAVPGSWRPKKIPREKGGAWQKYHLSR